MMSLLLILMGLREEYFWLKRIIESPKNRSHHRPALKTLVDLYEKRWVGKAGTKQNLVSISIHALKDLMRPEN
jgi:hypothetical protein